MAKANDLPMAPMKGKDDEAPSANERRVFGFSWRPTFAVLGMSSGIFLVVSLLQRSFNVVALGLFAALTLPVAAYFASLALKVKLIIDKEGITLTERGDSKHVPWTSLDGVSVGTVPGRPGVRQYRLFSMNQVVVKFENEISDSERAYRTIERRLSVALYPAYKDRLDRGETVNFGLVAVSKYTLGIRHISIALNEACIARQAGSVALRRRVSPDALIVVDEGDVQNINVLLRLLSEIDQKAIAVGFTTPG